MNPSHLAMDRSYRPSPFLRWVVDAYGLTVIDEATGQSEALDPETATVWELLLQRRPESEVARFASAILDLETEAAQARVSVLIARWIALGWIESLPPVPAPWPTSP